MDLNYPKCSCNKEQNFPQNHAKTIVFGRKTVSWRNFKVQLDMVRAVQNVHKAEKKVLRG